MTWDKYARQAQGWSENAYTDRETYLARRAELIRTLGPELHPGGTVLDLACGDGGLADFLPDQRYLGVDASAEMVASGRARGRQVIEADLNVFVPPEPVDATTIFRAIYYARDRRALLTRIGAYTTGKLVFDLNPRQYRLADVRGDLEAAGFDRLATHPFFVPQTRAPSRALQLLERSGPVAQLVLRLRFTLICAAWRASS
ncbi:MAG: class I SAM-dependent methyltransferase [Actinobacteria bacterium]|nr:class I SAM-dependent methyltransferase [Actinomycetota bacterium]MBV8480026.1 class I SAM-dependent methyltransferase [Actinomycetota bacterium]